MRSTSLDGTDWQVRACLGDEWRWHVGADKPWDAPGWLPARVPGSVLDDVWRAGLVPDPYRGTNSRAAEWVPARAWVYRRRVRAPHPDDRMVLRFDGVDHACTVHVDGQVVAEHEGMFLPFEADVTDQLADGREHLLAVVVHPAPASEPQVGETSRVRVHKSRMGYGWDFCPRMVHQGVWRPVTLQSYAGARLVDMSVAAKLSAARGTGTVRVEADVEAGVETATPAPKAHVTVTVTDPAGERVASLARDVDVGTRVVLTLDVEGPRLWWPNGHGDQPRYRVDVTTPGSRETRYVGFRDVRFSVTGGLEVNGTRLPVNGWNWVPVDAMYGVPRRERLEHLLRLARDAHVNLLRVWGGGLVETPEFYQLCDRFGLLVWQEFSMSSSGIESTPADDAAFVALLATEARDIVPRLRHHPSLAVWCGGNELSASGTPLDDSAPVLGALRATVTELDPDRAWLPTSPSRDGHDVHGPWEHQGLRAHYPHCDGGTCRLHSEFGVEGMTNRRTLERLVPEAQRWPADRGNPVYEHLGAWWNNAPLVQESFGRRVHDVETMRRASQHLQAEGLRYAVEANRRRGAGTLPWQFGESYPNAWCTAAVDHRGDPKPAYHAVRRVYEPAHVCAAFDRAAWGGESTFTASVWAWGAGPVSVTARLVDVHGEVVSERGWQLELVDGVPVELGEVNGDVAGLGDLWLLDLRLDGDALDSRARYVFSGTTDLAPLLDLAPATVDVDVEQVGEGWRVRLDHRAGPAALGLVLTDARPYDAEGWAVFTDNLFDLLPGESRTVDVHWRAAAGERVARLDGWNVEERLVR